MSHQHIPLTDALIEYVRSVSEAEPAYLADLREETALDPHARMQISVEQGAFFALLTRLLQPQHCLEVGVFTGYSSLSVARALPPGGHITACDISEHWTSIARRYWKIAGVEDRITLHLRPALETLDELIAQGRQSTFDFAFIDADKTNYAHYFERVLTLLRPGGLIAVDNVLWHGRLIDPADQTPDTVALRAFNQSVRNDTRVHQCLLPLGDGVTLAVKK